MDVKKASRIPVPSNHYFTSNAFYDFKIPRCLHRLIDLEKGQPMEVEVILGNAYREAKAKGVAVPYMETIYTLCNAVNQREKKAREMKAAQNTPV